MSVPRKLLVSCATGFLGRHVLAAHLGAHAVGRAVESAETWRAALRAAAGARVVHLAFPRERDPAVLDPFVERTCAALAEVMRENPGGHLVLASSAAVYAPALEALTEEHPIEPPSPYGRAKRAQELLLAEAADRAGWELTIARIFNILGPGQPRGLLAADLVAKLRAVEGTGPIPCGPLDTWRDYVDVREVAQRLAVLPPGLVNLCRGEAVSSLALAREICHALGVDASRLAPQAGGGGVSRATGAPDRLVSMGLALTTPWQRSLADQLER